MYAVLGCRVDLSEPFVLDDQVSHQVYVHMSVLHSQEYSLRLTERWNKKLTTGNSM